MPKKEHLSLSYSVLKSVNLSETHRSEKNITTNKIITQPVSQSNTGCDGDTKMKIARINDIQINPSSLEYLNYVDPLFVKQKVETLYGIYTNIQYKILNCRGQEASSNFIKLFSTSLKLIIFCLQNNIGLLCS